MIIERGILLDIIKEELGKSADRILDRFVDFFNET